MMVRSTMLILFIWAESTIHSIIVRFWFEILRFIHSSNTLPSLR